MRLIMCSVGLVLIVGLAQVVAAPNPPSEDLNADNGDLPIVVDIDIKPNSADNVINLGSKGLVAVAILSSEAFDATYVDESTVTLADAPVATKGRRGKWMAHVEDVNDDGLLDLVCQFETQGINLGQNHQQSILLIGVTLYDASFVGCDDVTVRVNGKKKSRR